jgi:hypothetical protein
MLLQSQYFFSRSEYPAACCGDRNFQGFASLFDGSILMNVKNFQLIIGLAILVHGVGHSMGVLAAFDTFATQTWHGRSWLLTPLVGPMPARVLGSVLFAMLTIAFVVAGLGFLGWGVPATLWQPLALIGAIVSLVMLFFYWNSFSAFFNKAGAIFVNIALLYGILGNQFPLNVQ